MFSGIPQSKGAWTSPPIWLQTAEVKGKENRKNWPWGLCSNPSIFTGLCLRGLWCHDEGAGGPLPPPEGEPPLLAGAPQVLRQEALQVLQLQLCLDAAAGQLISGWRWRRLSSLLLSAGIHQNEWTMKQYLERAKQQTRLSHLLYCYVLRSVLVKSGASLPISWRNVSRKMKVSPGNCRDIPEKYEIFPGRPM